MVLGPSGYKPPKAAMIPCKAICSQGQAVISVFIYCLRILHIYAAKGMRAFALAAAERMKELRRLDAKEHRGKVTHTIFSCKQQRLGWAQALHAWEESDATKNPPRPLCSAEEAWGSDVPCLGAPGRFCRLGGMRMGIMAFQPQSDLR